MSIFRGTFRLIQSSSAKLISNNASLKIHPIFSRLISSGTTVTCAILNTNQKNTINLNQLKNVKNFSSKHLEKLNNNESAKFFTYEITKNLTFISNKSFNVSVENRKTLKLKEAIDSPLVIIFSWIYAQKKHLFKYVKMYTDKGINVVAIDLKPWQLLWPTKGSKAVAADALEFLTNNTQFSPMIIHGFSVGGYLWGEMMVTMAKDLPKYQKLLNNINAQIWDSATDVSETSIGVPKAMFPNSKILQTILRNYIIYHMKVFHNIATIHYIKSCELFYNTLLKSPALFLVSKTDPIGSAKSNSNVKNNMDSAGIKTTWKCWDRSNHVAHYSAHPEEYLNCIYKHLEETNCIRKDEEQKNIE